MMRHTRAVEIERSISPVEAAPLLRDSAPEAPPVEGRLPGRWQIQTIRRRKRLPRAEPGAALDAPTGSDHGSSRSPAWSSWCSVPITAYNTGRSAVSRS